MGGRPTGHGADFYSADTDDLDAFVEHGALLQRRLAGLHETLARQRNFLLGAPFPEVVAASDIPTLDDAVAHMADLDRFVDDVSTALKQGTDHGRGVFSAPASRINTRIDETRERQLDELEAALLAEGVSRRQTAGLRSAIETLLAEDRRFEIGGATISEPGEMASALIANVEARAVALLDANRQTSSALHATPTVSVERLAAQLHFGEMNDTLVPPALLIDELGAALDDDQFTRLRTELTRLGHHEQMANHSLVAGAPPGLRITTGLADLTSQARALRDDNRVADVYGRGHRLDDAETAHQLRQMAKDDPGRAIGIKWLLDEMLTAPERADLNRMLATGGSFSDRVGLATRHPIDGAAGAAKGAWNDNAGWLVDGWADAQVAITNGLYGMAMHATPSAGDDMERILPRVPDGWDENEQVVELEFTIDDLAQRGGADLAFAVELASAGVGTGKGGITLVRVGRRFFLRSGDVVAEVGPTLARQLDEATPDSPTYLTPDAGPTVADAGPAGPVKDTQRVLREADITPVYAPDRIDHVLDGNINGFGRGSGGHYLRSSNLRVVETISTDDNGVVKAYVEIWDPRAVAWTRKSKPSTFFPSHWTRRRTTIEIHEAFKNSHAYVHPLRPDKTPEYWIGKSSEGIEIKGRYKEPGDPAAGWVSAFPLHQGG